MNQQVNAHRTRTRRASVRRAMIMLVAMALLATAAALTGSMGHADAREADAPIGAPGIDTRSGAPQSPGAPLPVTCIDYPGQTQSASYVNLTFDPNSTLAPHFWLSFDTEGNFSASSPPTTSGNGGPAENLFNESVFVWYSGNLDAHNVPGDPFSFSETNVLPFAASGDDSVEACAEHHFIYVDPAELVGQGQTGEVTVDQGRRLVRVDGASGGAPIAGETFTRWLRYVDRYWDLDQCLDYEPEPPVVENTAALRETAAGFCFRVFEDNNYFESWRDQYIDDGNNNGNNNGNNGNNNPPELPPWYDWVHSNRDEHGIGQLADGTYTCWGEVATRVGTENDDVIIGTSGNDVIVALGGDDYVEGGAGSDRICGGDGEDELWGNSGEDYIHGGLERDHIYGNSDKDELAGGEGPDRIRGGAGADDIFGGSEDDSITGDGGRDKIFGGAGDDDIDGNESRDDIWGGPGYDKANGGNANDVCRDDLEETRRC